MTPAELDQTEKQIHVWMNKTDYWFQKKEVDATTDEMIEVLSTLVGELRQAWAKNKELQEQLDGFEFYAAMPNDTFELYKRSSLLVRRRDS